MAKSKPPSSVQDLFSEISSKYGSESIFLLSNSSVEGIPVTKTGSLALDEALGVGGYPRGRVIEIMGNPSSGKTTLTLHAIAEAQKDGLYCLFIDAEHALDMNYARSIGVLPDMLYVSQPDYAEQALDILTDSIRSGFVGLVVVDSVAALAPIREIEGESGDAHVGLLARLMSQSLRRISGVTKKTGTTVMFVNQYRMNIATPGGYGPSKTTPGGKALEYYASVRLDVARIGSSGPKDFPLGNRTKVTVRKNKVAPPYKTAEFDIVFGAGISIEGEIIDRCLEKGIIVTSGSWYKMKDGTTIGQGKESVRNELIANDELRVSLLSELENS